MVHLIFVSVFVFIKADLCFLFHYFLHPIPLWSIYRLQIKSMDQSTLIEQHFVRHYSDTEVTKIRHNLFPYKRGWFVSPMFTLTNSYF